MMKTLLAAIMIVALLMLAPAGAERITEDVEIRGSVATGTFEYDYTSFAGFWYDLDKNTTSETLNVTVAAGTRDATVTYQCDPKPQDYKNGDLVGTYDIIGLFANQYVCYDGETDKLVKLLVKEDGADDHNVAMNELVVMPEDFAVAVTQIDLDGNKCIVVLYKDGVALDTEVCQSGNTYIYEDDEDVMIFSCKVSQVFRGTDTNMVTLDYMWLISDDILEIDNNDNFGEMEVTSTSGGITMESDGTIELSEDSEVDLTDELYFKVADSDDLRYYLAKKVGLECGDCPEINESVPCPEVSSTPCAPCPTVTPETIEIVKYVNVTVPEEPVNESPGFSGILPLIGLGAVAFLVLRQKE